MAHINFTRNVSQSLRQDLSHILPASNYAASFAALCGTAEQRRAAGMQGILRCVGRRGIVILQNDPVFASMVGSIPRTYPGLARRFPRFQCYSVNPVGQPCYYDPLYGLSADGVLNCVAPRPQDLYGSPAFMAARACLLAYLEIMELQFRVNPAPFGRFPFNLDLLTDLVSMPLRTLDQQVLQYLSSADRERIYSRLSQETTRQQAHDAVRAFAAGLEGRLWQYRGFAGHTGVSIIEAVRQRNLISINLPYNSPMIWAALCQELQALKAQGADFLLVACNINLGGARELQTLFTDPHAAMPYSTGLLAGSLTQAVSGQDQLTALLAEHQEVLIFTCSNAAQAIPFSNALGTYRRIVYDRSRRRSRLPFHIFSITGSGITAREQVEHIINPQELVDLNRGAVLCGSLYNPPVIIRHVNTDLQNWS